MRLQRLDDRLTSAVELGFAGVLLGQRDDDLVVGRWTIALDPGIVDARAIRSSANLVDVRRLVKLHVDQRSALEVHPERNAVPEQHRQQAGHAENQREAEEVPLFTKPIDIYITKQFH